MVKLNDQLIIRPKCWKPFWRPSQLRYVDPVSDFWESKLDSKQIGSLNVYNSFEIQSSEWKWSGGCNVVEKDCIWEQPRTNESRVVREQVGAKQEKQKKETENVTIKTTQKYLLKNEKLDNNSISNKNIEITKTITYYIVIANTNAVQCISFSLESWKRPSMLSIFF